MGRKLIVCSTVLALLALQARAAFQVEIKFSNGASRTLSSVTVQDGKLILSGENLSVPLAQVQSARFVFDQLPAENCAALWNRGAYKELADRTTAALAEAGRGIELPGNVDEFMMYRLRACFWTQRFAEAQETVDVLQAKNSTHSGVAGLYSVLILIEQKKEAEAAVQFTKIKEPGKISAPMSEYIQGRLAAGKRDFDAALKNFATITAYYDADQEWMPAAAFQEGLVYKRTGYLDAAANVAEELKIAYPDRLWGQRAGELK